MAALVGLFFIGLTVVLSVALSDLFEVVRSPAVRVGTLLMSVAVIGGVLLAAAKMVVEIVREN